MSDNAIARARDFSWDATTDKLFDVYRHACEAPPRPYDTHLDFATVPTAVVP